MILQILISLNVNHVFGLSIYFTRGGELAYVVILGCAIILGGCSRIFGYLFGLFSDFWVSFFGYFRIFGYHFWVKFDFFTNNPDFGVLILIFPSMTLWNVAAGLLFL